MLEESETTFESWFLVAFDAVARSIWKMQEWPIARKALGVIPMNVIGMVDANIVNVLKMLKVGPDPVYFSVASHYILMSWSFLISLPKAV